MAATVKGRRRRWQRRRIRLFGVGSPKSGTHSVAGLFATRYRTAHEPEARRLVELLIDRAEGRATDGDLVRYLRGRERRLRLEVNCAGLNGLVVEHLVPLTVDSRFLLTIREPRAWLESLLNHSLERDAPEHYRRLRAIRFGADRPHPDIEQPLADQGLYTLDGYLHSWAERNRRALDVVPAERLLVVRTDDLASSVGDIAAFAGVRAETLDAARAHEFAAPRRYGALAAIPEDYIQERIHHHGADLVDRFFSTR